MSFFKNIFSSDKKATLDKGLEKSSSTFFDKLTKAVVGKSKVDEVKAGDLCAIVGLEGFEIGDTVADIESPEALPTIKIDEPTMSMLFTINDSPFFGQEGKFVTSRHLKNMYHW